VGAFESTQAFRVEGAYERDLLNPVAIILIQLPIPIIEPRSPDTRRVVVNTILSEVLANHLSLPYCRYLAVATSLLLNIKLDKPNTRRVYNV
jgi:hypothetical protein